MEMKLSRSFALLNNCFEKLFKFLQILLPKMKRKTESTVDGTNFISKSDAQTYTPIAIPQIKSNKDFFHINKTVILNEY